MISGSGFTEDLPVWATLGSVNQTASRREKEESKRNVTETSEALALNRFGAEKRRRLEAGTMCVPQIVQLTDHTIKTERIGQPEWSTAERGESDAQDHCQVDHPGVGDNARLEALRSLVNHWIEEPLLDGGQLTIGRGLMCLDAFSIARPPRRLAALVFFLVSEEAATRFLTERLRLSPFPRADLGLGQHQR